MVRCFSLAEVVQREASVVFFTNSDAVIEKCLIFGFTFIKCKNDFEGLSVLKTTEPSIIISAILIDTKSNYSLETVSGLRERCAKIIFIENISIGTLLSDKVVFPAAHFLYEEVYKDFPVKFPLSKIIQGPEYILIRSELRELETKSGASGLRGDLTRPGFCGCSRAGHSLRCGAPRATV